MGPKYVLSKPTKLQSLTNGGKTGEKTCVHVKILFGSCYFFVHFFFFGKIPLAYPKVWANTNQLQDISKLTNLVLKDNLIPNHVTLC